MASVRVGASLVDRVALNDGTSMPLFGLGMFRSESGSGREAEVVAGEALKAGYRCISISATRDPLIPRGPKMDGLGS